MPSSSSEPSAQFLEFLMFYRTRSHNLLAQAVLSKVREDQGFCPFRQPALICSGAEGYRFDSTWAY